MTSALQSWVLELPVMQQAVLMTALRGPDGVPKGHISKQLIKFYRRCVLVTAFEHEALNDPAIKRVGSFTGQSVPEDRSDDWTECMNVLLDEYLEASDEMPHHFQMHFLHGAEILGYHHLVLRVRRWWNNCYLKIVKSMHLQPESEERMNFRLGDVESQWRECQVI